MDKFLAEAAYKTLEKGVEKSVKKGVEKNIFEDIAKFSETTAEKNILERKYNELQKFMRDTESRQKLETLKFERRPENLTKDIVTRMYQDGLTPESWQRANYNERYEMLRKAADIMSQEMMIPDSVRSRLMLDVDQLEGNCNGATNKFITELPDGEIVMSDIPMVTIDVDRILLYDSSKAYTTLFHEMVHVLEEASVLENELWSEDVKYWKDDILSYKGVPAKNVDYFTGAMEATAHMQDGLFEKVYLGKYQDNQNELKKAAAALNQAEAEPLFASSNSLERLESYQRELDYEKKMLSEAKEKAEYYANNLNHPKRYTSFDGKINYSVLNDFKFELDKWKKEVSKRENNISIIKSNISSLS